MRRFLPLSLALLLACTAVSPHAYADAANACDLNELKGIAQRRQEAKAHTEDAKRGIAGMPYSAEKLQAAEKELLTREPKAAETAFRNLPDDMGSELKRLEALTARSAPSAPAERAHVPSSAFSDGSYTGEKKAGANLAVFANKLDPPGAAQREAMEQLLSQTNPRMDQIIVVVDRHANTLYADRVRMAQLALPKDPRIQFADFNKLSSNSHANLIDQIAKKNPGHTVTAVVTGEEVLSKDFAFGKSANARYAVITGKDDSEMIMSVAALKAGERKGIVSSVPTEAGGFQAKTKAADLDSSSFAATKAEAVITIGPDEVGLIGYGSLINRSSIEKTLGHALPANGLKEVAVRGWKRSWDVFMPNEAFYEKTADGGRNYPPKIAYLNFTPDPGCTANCSLFVISKKDLEGFDKREWIYERRDLSGSLSGVKIEGGGAAYAYVGRKQFLYDPANPGEVRMRSSYFDIVEKALEEKSPEYRKDYWAGTDLVQPPRIADFKDLTKRQMDQPLTLFGPPVPSELAPPVVPLKTVGGIPTYAASDRAALKLQKPAVAAALEYQEAGARALAAVRRQYWKGKASFPQLEAAQAKFGHLEAPVSGTSQTSRRAGYLRQEQSYVARELARAQSDGNDLKQIAALRRQLAAVGASQLGETEKRAREIAANPATAKAARHEAVASFEQIFQRNQAEFPVTTFQQAMADPKQAELVQAIVARDARTEAAAASEAREALVSAVQEKLPSNQGPEKLAQDIIELHASGREPSTLLKQGWSKDLVEKCVIEAICVAKLEAPVSPAGELSVRAKAAIAEHELASATGTIALEASRVAPPAPVKSAAELRTDRAALETETAEIAKRAETDPAKFKPLEAEARSALAVVNDKIEMLEATKGTLQSARPLAKVEEQVAIPVAVRELASVETPEALRARAETELSTLGGIKPAQRAELVDGIAALAGKDLGTAHGALEKFKALSGNPDMLETFRMSFAEASKELPKAKSWGAAWEQGVKRMLSESGYSKEEIRRVVDKESGVRFYQQTARCLRI